MNDKNAIICSAMYPNINTLTRCKNAQWYRYNAVLFSEYMLKVDTSRSCHSMIYTIAAAGPPLLNPCKSPAIIDTRAAFMRLNRKKVCSREYYTIKAARVVSLYSLNEKTRNEVFKRDKKTSLDKISYIERKRLLT